MARRRRHGGGGGHGHGGAEVEGAPFWMITYADLVTLMFAFFVMLSTMSNRDTVKVKLAIESIAAALGVMDGNGLLPGENIDSSAMTRADVGTTDPQPNLLQSLYDQLSRYASNDFVQVGQTDTGVHVVLGEALLFRPGSDLIQPGAYPFLNEVADAVGRSGGQVELQGHADDGAPGGAWRSNWDLAAARANAVLLYVQARSGVAADRFRAVSYGATRPRWPGESERDRARNRRVEVQITVNSARDEYFFGEPRWEALPPRTEPAGVHRD